MWWTCATIFFCWVSWCFPLKEMVSMFYEQSKLLLEVSGKFIQNNHRLKFVASCFDNYFSHKQVHSSPNYLRAQQMKFLKCSIYFNSKMFFGILFSAAFCIGKQPWAIPDHSHIVANVAIMQRMSVEELNVEWISNNRQTFTRLSWRSRQQLALSSIQCVFAQFGEHSP